MPRLTADEVRRIILDADPEDVEAARDMMATWSDEQVRRFADTGEWPEDADEADVGHREESR